MCSASLERVLDLPPGASAAGGINCIHSRWTINRQPEYSRHLCQTEHLSSALTVISGQTKFA